MSRQSPLSALEEEFQPAEKGRAAAAPLAAVPSQPAAETVPPAAEIAPGQGREPRIQVAFRLSYHRHEQLRRISYELNKPVQHILEELLCGSMDSHDAKRGRGPGKP